MWRVLEHGERREDGDKRRLNGEWCHILKNRIGLKYDRYHDEVIIRKVEKMYHEDEIRVAMIEMLYGLPDTYKINMANTLIAVLEKKRDGNNKLPG